MFLKKKFMEEKLKYETIVPFVRQINKQLFEKGLTLRQLDAFWKDCIAEVKKREVMALFYEGLSDAEIAEITGYGAYYVGTITVKGLSERITKEMLKS